MTKVGPRRLGCRGGSGASRAPSLSGSAAGAAGASVKGTLLSVACLSYCLSGKGATGHEASVPSTTPGRLGQGGASCLGRLSLSRAATILPTGSVAVSLPASF